MEEPLIGWATPDVPHKGWACIEIVDLADGEGEYSGQCEMCGYYPLRFAHQMEHQEYSGVLGVGAVCANKMAEGYNSKVYERQLKNRAVRKNKWLTRKWRISQKGHPFLNIDGKNIGVFQTGGGSWRFWVDRIFSNANYPTVNQVKLALFDYLWPPAIKREGSK